AGSVATPHPLVDPPRDEPRPLGAGVQADEVERASVSPELEERRRASPEQWIGRIAGDGVVALASGILKQSAVAEDVGQREVAFSAVAAATHEVPGNVVAVLETPRIDLEAEQNHSGGNMPWIQGRRLS